MPFNGNATQVCPKGTRHALERVAAVTLWLGFFAGCVVVAELISVHRH